MDSEIRTCRGTCGRSLPATDEYFYREKAGKYLAHRCKRCVCKQAARYYSANPKNPPREVRCGLCGVKFMGDPRRGSCQQCLPRWNELRIFREKAKVLGGNAATRARLKGIENSLTHREITVMMAVTPRCPICDREINYQIRGSGGFAHASPSIDRLIPARGYAIGNVAIICNRCNILKADATASELEAIAKWIRAQTSARDGL